MRYHDQYFGLGSNFVGPNSLIDSFYLTGIPRGTGIYDRDGNILDPQQLFLRIAPSISGTPGSATTFRFVVVQFRQGFVNIPAFLSIYQALDAVTIARTAQTRPDMYSTVFSVLHDSTHSGVASTESAVDLLLHRVDRFPHLVTYSVLTDPNDLSPDACVSGPIVLYVIRDLDIAVGGSPPQTTCAVVTRILSRSRDS